MPRDVMDFSDYKLVPGEKQNGHLVYRDLHGVTKEAYEIHLEDYLHEQLLSRFLNLAGIVNDELYQRFMFLWELIVDDASKKMGKVFDLIEEKIGTISVHAFTQDYPYTGKGVPVDVFLEPKAEPETPKLSESVSGGTDALHQIPQEEGRKAA